MCHQAWLFRWVLKIKLKHFAHCAISPAISNNAVFIQSDYYFEMGSYYTARAGLRLVVNFFPQSPMCQDYRGMHDHTRFIRMFLGPLYGKRLKVLVSFLYHGFNLSQHHLTNQPLLNLLVTKNPFAKLEELQRGEDARL